MTPNGLPLISVVFSFRNEEAVLGELIRRMEAVFAQASANYELIFVNDDSTDRSLDLLVKQRERNPRIRIINMARRFGVFECMAAGMAETSGDAVIYMDSDLQDPPELIPTLLGEWRKGADVVHTVRTRRHGESPLKTWATRMAYRIVRFDSQPQLPIDAGDFKLLSRRAVQALNGIQESDPYMRGLAVWIGFPQAYVPYERDGRHAGRTHFPFFSRNPWKTFLLGVTSFSFAPLYLAFAAGLAGVAASFILLLLGSWRWAILMFFWATTMTAMGLLGFYVARIYKDVRGRPRYIVRDRIGF